MTGFTAQSRQIPAEISLFPSNCSVTLPLSPFLRQINSTTTSFITLPAIVQFPSTGGWDLHDPKLRTVCFCMAALAHRAEQGFSAGRGAALLPCLLARAQLAPQNLRGCVSHAWTPAWNLGGLVSVPASAADLPRGFERWLLSSARCLRVPSPTTAHLASELLLGTLAGSRWQYKSNGNLSTFCSILSIALQSQVLRVLSPWALEWRKSGFLWICVLRAAADVKAPKEKPSACELCFLLQDFTGTCLHTSCLLLRPL